VEGERVIFMQSAGNLATTQSVISLIEQRIRQSDHHILNTASLFEVAEMVGHTVRSVIERDSGQNQGVNFNCNMLISGQIRDEAPRLFHVYPEGNFIEAGVDTPYFQIGESKYGKPILDRVIHHETTLEKGLQCALISMDSTLRSNLSVGLPLDALIYRNGQLKTDEIYRIDENNTQFQQLRQTWSEGIKNLFDSLPFFVVGSNQKDG